MWENEHHYSMIAAPPGPTPLWCKLMFIAAVVTVVVTIAHPLWKGWL